MKLGFQLIFSIGLVPFLLNGCEKKQEVQHKMDNHQQAFSSENFFSGEIVETMNAGGYTYFAINHENEKIWAAVTERELPIGLNVSFEKSMEMTNFHSETLDRTFETIYFVNKIKPGTGPKTMTPEIGMDKMKQSKVHSEAPSHSDIDFTDLTVPEDGKKISEVFDEKDELNNKTVRIRGKVVKFVTGVMGKNWIHIQDGSGDTGTNDLTITCDETVAVGDVVFVEGILTLNKDFGFGYKYDLIIEDALVIKE